MSWSEIGSEHARTLIAQCDKMSRVFADALQGVRGETLPAFRSAKWRYEFCIFIMFWLWYVANSPKFTRDGATKPLLDAFHRGCYEAFRPAKLIDDTEGTLRRWEEDVEARLLSYKEAYDARLARIHQDPHLETLNISGRGGIGWLLLHQLFPSSRPDPRVVVLLDEFGSAQFTGLVDMFRSLEKHYARPKPRWKFWS